MYDVSITLFRDTAPGESKKEVFAQLKSIGQKEFYASYGTDLAPEKVFVPYTFEYDDENRVIYDGIIYRVIRTYNRDDERTELICEKNSVQDYGS